MVKMDKESAKQAIRQGIPCTRFLEKSKSGGYCCPLPDCNSGHNKNATGGVKYYADTNTWFCHACNRGGDVIDLYQMQTGADYNTALKELAEEIGITIDNYNPNKQPQKRAQSNEKHQSNTISLLKAKTQESEKMSKADYTAYYEACKKRIYTNEAKEYLEKRKISIATAEKYGVGFDPEADPANAPGGIGNKYYPAPRLIIPISPDYYVARAICKVKFEKMYPKDGKAALFNKEALYAPEVQYVYVAEAAFDALSILEMGKPAIALNSTNNQDKLIEALEQERTKATLILCLDNDDSGAKATETLKKELKRLNIKFVTADICKDCKDPNEALQKNPQKFFEALEYTEAAIKQFEEDRKQRTGAQMIDNFLDVVKTEKYKPIPTGIKDIDNAIGGGFIRQQLVLLGAAPALGKTALAQWIFETMAKNGQDCLYLNLEMSKEQMLARSISRLAAKNGGKLKPTEILQGYKWTPDQESAIKEAAAEYKATIAPHIIYNPDGVTTELDSILQHLEKEAQRSTITPAVVIDYLQIIRGREREEDTAIIKRTVSSLKDFAIKYNTVVFLIIAHNRKSNSTGRVSQESGRDTSALEYSADLQLALTYTDTLEEGTEPEKLTPEAKAYRSLVVTKARWGNPNSRADLYFNGETMTFRQIETNYN